MCTRLLDNPLRPAWQITYDESAHLSTIDGFLIAYRGRCSITLRSTLSAIQKEAITTQLLTQLPATPGAQRIHLHATQPA